jgi:ankyrin
LHNTPLIPSVLSDQLDAASALLTSGANVEATEEAGVRPIHLAAEVGDPQLVALLLDHGARLDAQTTDGRTALAIATAHEHAEAAALLREREAR